MPPSIFCLPVGHVNLILAAAHDGAHLHVGSGPKMERWEPLRYTDLSALEEWLYDREPAKLSCEEARKAVAEVMPEAAQGDHLTSIPGGLQDLFNLEAEKWRLSFARSEDCVIAVMAVKEQDPAIVTAVLTQQSLDQLRAWVVAARLRKLSAGAPIAPAS